MFTLYILDDDLNPSFDGFLRHMRSSSKSTKSRFIFWIWFCTFCLRKSSLVVEHQSCRSNHLWQKAGSPLPWKSPFFRCAFMFRCPQPAIHSFSGLFVQTVMLSGHFYEESVNVIAIRYRERKESLFIANKAKATSLNSAILSSVGKFQQKWFDKTFVKSNQAQLFNVRVPKRVNNQIYFRLFSWVAWYHAWQSSSLMGRNGMTMNFF